MSINDYLLMTAKNGTTLEKNTVIRLLSAWDRSPDSATKRNLSNDM